MVIGVGLKEGELENAFDGSQCFPYVFLDQTIFGMKPLSKADRERAGNQKIPKLTELLELCTE